ncbi:MAG: hypothetical protein JST81_02760 [Bacteroidetes bacterium]|nr:hypothetical protein [Bacteroidota bacterium]
MKVTAHREIDHFWHECMAWGRALDFYLQENAYFKTRLSQALDNNIDKEFLEKAEYFQNCFLETDDKLHALKKNIVLFQRQLKNSLVVDSALIKRLLLDHHKLDAEIAECIMGFEKLKKAFSTYLLSLLHH